jgi:hypothetical protein
MSYYGISPFGDKKEPSYSMSVGQEGLGEMLEAAYQEIIEDTNLYDFSVKSNHEEVVFIFSSLNDFQKAAELLEEQHIPYQTSIVDEVSEGRSDILTSTRKFRTIKRGEPDMDGLDNLELRKTYESE